VLALDPKTGKLKWYFQFTPHDTHDWDATETPVLIDALFRGKMRKLLIHADRNAFYYVLDRETGQFLHGKAFSRQTWAKGLDDSGHPVVRPGTDPTPEGKLHLPGRKRGDQLGRAVVRSENEPVHRGRTRSLRDLYKQDQGASRRRRLHGHRPAGRRDRRRARRDSRARSG